MPAARRLAGELGVDLGAVTGSGPRGRVQSVDVQSEYDGRRRTTEDREPIAEAGTAPVGTGGVRVVPLVGMRRTIAQRMQASMQQAPHITFQIDVDAGAAEALRLRANRGLTDGVPAVSLSAVIAAACAWALRRHPFMNSRLEGENILLIDAVNLGIAVALNDGLIVPVIHDADQKGIVQLATAIADLAARARSGKLRAADLDGGTFTISNLGMFGVDRFTAIINPPETAILAVGRVQKRVVVDERPALSEAKGDTMVVRPIMTLTLSADHRVVDGAVAARFLADLRAALEDPQIMLL